MASTHTLKSEQTLDDAKRHELIGLLSKAYHAEIETVANYLANSVQLDGMLANAVKASLDADVTEELNHARQLAARIKVLGGRVPGSKDLTMTQDALQPPEDPLDLRGVILGVIEAEDGAIDTYQQLIDAAGGVDPVTEDLAITLKGDEEEHRRAFLGYLREYDALKATLSRD